MGTARARSALAAVALCSLVAACGGKDRPSAASDGTGDDGSGSADAGADGAFFDVGTSDGPPALDASGLCGNQALPALADPANLYFVVDRSGSMADGIAGAGSQSKYKALRGALVSLVRDLGSRVNVGAALFPATSFDTCAPGAEVLSTRAGDDPSWKAKGIDGPATTAFADATGVSPFGGTPTASTFQAIASTLLSLSGRTYVVLATDGAPNCNEGATCAAADCIPNIEGDPACPSSTNCCDAESGAFGPSLCLQGKETRQAIAQLYQAGIRTYVIGLPSAAGEVGVPAYASVLDGMAVAGGTARTTTPKYYAVGALSELDQVLASIGSRVVLSCDFKLAEVPPDASQVNVYLDQDELAYDAVDGWVWTGAQSLELRGAACERLESGQVTQVQVVAGCPTKQPD